MKKVLVIILSIYTICFYTYSSSAFAANNKEATKRIVIKMIDQKTISNFQFKSYNVQDKKKNIKILEVPQTESKNVLEALKQDSSIEFAEAEIQYHYLSTTNDEFFQNMQMKDFSLIQGPEAWDLFIPKKTPIVAVLDSGIDTSNPDLQHQIYKPYNIVEPGTPPFDDVGHGTHVAGIVGAETNNGIGVSSLSKGALIMPVKVGDANYISSIDIADGIYYAVDNGASIINISIGNNTNSLYIEDAINYAYSKGVLVVAAAGNEGTSKYSYPAALKSVVSVAGVDSQTDSLADFSSYGDWVSVAAPAVDIFSTYPTHLGTNAYEQMSGTSMASPMVASLAALLKNQDPDLSHNQIRWIMEYSSEPYNRSEYNQNGRINAYEALREYNDFSRIYGDTSVETSSQIAEMGWPEGPSNRILAPHEGDLNPNKLKQEGKFAILASNQSFPDSLSAGALSFTLDAPILLTYPNRLSQSTINTLQRHQITNVLVLGGPSAVSDSVLTGLKNQGFSINRLQGEDRFETAAEVNDYVGKTGGEVIIANGRNFPDALSVSSFSAKNQIPIVFVDRDNIAQSTKDFLNKYQFSKTIVIGGPEAVSENVLKQLPNPERIAGSDRFETNTKVINYFMGEQEMAGFIFATGRNYPDALAGGPFAAKMNYPLILTNIDMLPQSSDQYLQNRVENNHSYYDMITLGGNAALSSSLIWKIDRLFYGDYYQQAYSPSSRYQVKNKEMKTRFIKK
ncbi:S8 family serine peptidase [Neobacillus sp. OS1-2]|uniref:cell wall-binding repeat-containing protein n=1 Tax=Neobacillus sp. OS1-2 TaxID=3070680 RepID=UPI0027E06CB4|nr:cell wall-binding repeat-containing protein [Neobacillus sp. OS1-2]WML41221.1 S8 family serine peptidase [Neobacillus sp. OS1-2]